jgi:hypothetical protein
MQRDLAAITGRAENNKERFNWWESAVTPFEGKYSKHRTNLNRSHEERHARSKSNLDQSRNAPTKKGKLVS